MPEDRLLRILARIASPSAGPATSRLCAVCAEVTEMSGAGIMLMLDDRPHGSVCSTDRVSATLEDLQYTLGEGPCVDAHREQRPVLEPDLADPASARWLAFSGPAVAAGARAVFGFPMIVRDVRLGALNLYRDHIGGLTPAQHADAAVLADIAARSVLGMQTGATPGGLGRQLEVGTNLRHTVHQAVGMASVQLDVPVAEALLRLRAHAYRHDRSIDAIAEDVVARRLRFDRADDQMSP